MSLEFKIIVFILVTIAITWLSRSSLRNPKCHGFYRFFAWETILALFLINMDFWFIEPFSLPHIISWIFLLLSLVFIIFGVRTFRKYGMIDQGRNDPGLVGIEKTTELVTTGIYQYIRHPFYSSLLFLGWGISLKRVSWTGFALVVITTFLLLITTRKEEVENIEYFGEAYQAYMKETKMFIPYIL